MQSALSPRDVDFIPERLEEGVLYICERFNTAAHKCCCGCGGEVVTPLTPADWSIRREGGMVTLSPSIGNWGFACRSHYLIRQNRVVWAATMSPGQISMVRKRDLADKVAYAAAQNRRKEAAHRDSLPKSPRLGTGESGLRHLWQIIMRLWKG